MIQYKITLHFEAEDNKSTWNDSGIESVEGYDIKQVTDEAVAKIGDRQRYWEAELERADNIIPEDNEGV